MQIVKNDVLTLPGAVVAIGAFDGVHKGHQAVIRGAVEKSQKAQVPSVVYTFDPPPRHFFKSAQILTPILEKVKRIEKLGVDYLVVARFDEAFATRPPQEFIGELLKLNPVEIIVGSDFRFGKNRAGDADLLKMHFPVHITSPVYCQNGKRISSTRIRQLVADGDMQQTHALLGWSMGM